MTPAQLETARALVRSPHWRWLSGCRWRFDLPHHAVLWNVYEGPVWIDDDGIPGTNSPPSARGPVVPDLTDPATVGCLAHLAITAHGCHLWVKYENDTYFVDRTNPDIPTRTIQVASGPCLGTAWAAAILAAPEAAP
jgi:hypothetical protein